MRFAVAVVLVLGFVTARVCFGEGGSEAKAGARLPEGNVGIAAKYPGDVGIENDPDVIYATGFEDGTPGALKKNRAGVVILEAPEIARTGKVCARITAIRGKDTGGDLIYTWEPAVDQCFARVYVKFHKDTVTPHHFIGMGGRGPNYEWGGGAGFRPKGDSRFGATIEP
ncbi:MAG: hypothetical protein KAX80_01570, partial [Planctomycetes bacterium]|nr:hypothetical protein [Planctomycetota bacterium]